jgi:hypothetical protein
VGGKVEVNSNQVQFESFLTWGGKANVQPDLVLMMGANG